MAVKFLDYTGLGYFWSKIKAWCNATFAAITHNHASSAINAMTGYSKPASSSAIATTDTLNQAIGKLEKAIDDADITNVVHRTGNETINGTKVFIQNIGSSIELAKGTLPSGNDSLWKSFVFTDSTKTLGASTALGAVNMQLTPSGNTIAILRAYKWIANSEDNAYISVACPISGDPYAIAPSTSENRSFGQDIVTRDWIPKDERIVHIGGKERVIGQKYFNQYFNVEVPLVRGTVPSEPVYSGFSFYDTSEFAISDGDNTRKFGALTNIVGSDGSSHTYMRAYKNAVGGDDSAVLEVVYPASGDPYAAAPSTSTSRNAGTDIVTRDFIPNDTRIVHISAKENVTGDKTFSGGLSVHSNTISLGTAPASSTQYLSLWFFSKDHDVAVSSGADTIGVSRLAEITYAAETNNARRIQLVLRKPEAGETSAVGTIGIQYDAGASSPRAYCTSTPDTGFGVDILTRDWIPRDDRIVRVTGTQTITGEKTFDRYLRIFHSSGNASRSMSVTVSADATTVGCWDTDNSKWVWNSDANGNASFKGNADTATKLATARNLKVALGSTTAVTFDGSADQNSIPVSGTLAVANGGTGSATKNFVDLSNAQTVGGTKTFSANILCNAYRGASSDKQGSVTVEGGTSGTAALVTFYGCQHASYAGQFAMRARASNGDLDRSLTGRPGGTLTWNGQTIQTSSDQRLKTSLTIVSDEILDVWEEVEWGEFKFLDAVEEKGDKARVHLGLIAQRVKSVFENHDLDICSYGILCHEEHEATEEESAVDLWMIRYTEALCMEAACQRRKNKILENRISELERQVSDMLQILQSLKGAN